MHKITNIFIDQSRLVIFNELGFGSKPLFYRTTLYHRRRKTPIRQEIWTFTVISAKVYIRDHAYVLLNYESLHRVIVWNASPALSYSRPTLTKSGCFRFRRCNELQHPRLSRSSYRPTRRRFA